MSPRAKTEVFSREPKTLLCRAKTMLRMAEKLHLMPLSSRLVYDFSRSQPKVFSRKPKTLQRKAWKRKIPRFFLYFTSFNYPPLKTPRKGEKCKKYPIFCKKYPNKKLPFTLNFATNRSTSATPCGLKSKTTNKTITINLLLTILPEETFSKGEQKLINYEK